MAHLEQSQSIKIHHSGVQWQQNLPLQLMTQLMYQSISDDAMVDVLVIVMVDVVSMKTWMFG